MVHATRNSRKDFPSTSPFLETRVWWCIWIQSWYRHRDMWAVERAHTHTYIYNYSFAPSSKKHKFHMNLVLGSKCFSIFVPCGSWSQPRTTVDHHWPVKPQAHPLTVGLQVGVWKALRQSLPVPKSVGRALKKAPPFNTNWTCEQLNGDSFLFFREFHRIPGSIWLCGWLWFDVLMIGIYLCSQCWVYA
jgi:hypothetical protein